MLIHFCVKIKPLVIDFYMTDIVKQSVCPDDELLSPELARNNEILLWVTKVFPVANDMEMPIMSKTIIEGRVLFDTRTKNLLCVFRTPYSEISIPEDHEYPFIFVAVGFDEHSSPLIHHVCLEITLAEAYVLGLATREGEIDVTFLIQRIQGINLETYQYDGSINDMFYEMSLLGQTPWHVYARAAAILRGVQARAQRFGYDLNVDIEPGIKIMNPRIGILSPMNYVQRLITKFPEVMNWIPLPPKSREVLDYVLNQADDEMMPNAMVAQDVLGRGSEFDTEISRHYRRIIAGFLDIGRMKGESVPRDLPLVDEFDRLIYPRSVHHDLIVLSAEIFSKQSSAACLAELNPDQHYFFWFVVRQNLQGKYPSTQRIKDQFGYRGRCGVHERMVHVLAQMSRTEVRQMGRKIEFVLKTGIATGVLREHLDTLNRIENMIERGYPFGARQGFVNIYALAKYTGLRVYTVRLITRALRGIEVPHEDLE